MWQRPRKRMLGVCRPRQYELASLGSESRQHGLRCSLRHERLISVEQFAKMLVHGSDLARPRRDRALEFGAALDEAAKRPFKRDFRCGSIERPGARHKLIAGGATVGDNQGNAASPSFCGDHAESLRLTAMDQCVGTCDQPCKLVAIVDSGKHGCAAKALGKKFEGGST